MADPARRRIPKWLVITGIVVVVLAVGLNLTKGFDSQPAPQEGTTKSQGNETTGLPKFEIVKVDDVSVAATPRFIYRVSVGGQPTAEQLKEIAAEVFKRAQAEREFSALRVGFFDYPEYANGEFTLGTVDYAPEGDWASADSVEPGDYGAMKATADLPDKDWSKQLTPDEVKVWGAWRAEHDAAAKAIGSDPGKVVDEDAVTKKVVASTGKSTDEVKAILIKQQVWASQ